MILSPFHWALVPSGPQCEVRMCISTLVGPVTHPGCRGKDVGQGLESACACSYGRAQPRSDWDLPGSG